MNPSVTYLVSIVVDGDLFRFAMRFNDENKIPLDMEYPMEKECREWLMLNMPEYLRGFPIVYVEKIDGCDMFDLF